jgi:hypothetical protein
VSGIQIFDDAPPIPSPRVRYANGLADTLRRMRPGQYALVPYGESTPRLRMISVSGQAGRVAKERGDARFVCRRLPDGIGVWCLAREP